MNKISLLTLLSVIVVISCAKRNFSYVPSSKFDNKVVSQYGADFIPLFKEDNALQNRKYFLGIALKDTFLGGELTFTQTARYLLEEEYLQYCYLLFDHKNNVYYNTFASDSIQKDTLIPCLPNTIGLDTLTINDYPDALQGKYFITDDTLLHMILESKEQSELVYMKARLQEDNSNWLTIFQVTRKRLTFSPVISRDGRDPKQKVFDLNNVFSIDLCFKQIPTNEKIQIRRDSLEKKGGKGFFSSN